jgi:uncharacterized RDD family membrane protein YckC
MPTPASAPPPSPPPPPVYGAPGYPPQAPPAPPPPYGAPPGYGGGGWSGGPSFSHGSYAGFGARLGATLLDGIFVLLLLLPFGGPAIFLIIRSLEDCVSVENFDGTSELVCPPGAPDGAMLGGGIALAVIGYLAVFIFYVIRMLAKSGQTWGRRIANIKVVRLDNGQPPGWGRAIGRVLFANFISGQCCYLGYLWMLWDKDKRTWHDMVAGTRVIKV